MKMDAGGSRRACPFCVPSCLVLPGGRQPRHCWRARPSPSRTSSSTDGTARRRRTRSCPATSGWRWSGPAISTRSTRASSTLRCARRAQAWQKSKGHPPTDKLPDDQKVELVSEALKERDEVGWSVLRDSAVGVAVGFPAKLVTFGAPRTEGNILWYHGGGEVSQSMGVHLGYPSCRNLDGALPAGHRQGELSRPAGQLVRRLVQARRDAHLHQRDAAIRRVRSRPR